MFEAAQQLAIIRQLRFDKYPSGTPFGEFKIDYSAASVGFRCYIYVVGVAIRVSNSKEYPLGNVFVVRLSLMPQEFAKAFLLNQKPELSDDLPDDLENGVERPFLRLH